MRLLAAWHDIDAGERLARLRCLQALARVLGGPAAEQLVAALRQAETDAAALPAADAQLDAMPTIPRRRILSSFAATLPAPVSSQETRSSVSPLPRRDKTRAVDP
jgi:hypothetical protein